MAITRANLLIRLFCVWTAVKTADAAPTMKRRDPHHHHSHDGWANTTNPCSSVSVTATTAGIYTDQPGNLYKPAYLFTGTPDIVYTAPYISTIESDTPCMTNYVSTTESNTPCTTAYLSTVQSRPANTTPHAHTHSKSSVIHTTPCSSSIAHFEIWSTTTISVVPQTTPCAEATGIQSTTQPTSTYVTTSSAVAQTEGLPCTSDSQSTYSAAGTTWNSSDSQVSHPAGTTSYMYATQPTYGTTPNMYAPQPTYGIGIALTTVTSEATWTAGNTWSTSGLQYPSTTSVASSVTLSTWMPPTQVTSAGSSSQCQYPPGSESPSCPSMSTNGCPPAAHTTTWSVPDSQSMSTTTASIPPPKIRQPSSESVSTTMSKHTSHKMTTSPTDIPLTVIPVTFITSSTKVQKVVDPNSTIPTSILSPPVAATKVTDGACISTDLGNFGTVGCIDTRVPAATVAVGLSGRRR